MPGNQTTTSNKTEPATLNRIQDLRRILEDLRISLDLERSRLQEEMQKIVWTTYCATDPEYPKGHEDNLALDEDHLDVGRQLRTHSIQLSSRRYDDWNGYPERLIITEDYIDGGHIARSTLSNLSNFYKKKILDLQADCCAELNQVKCRFIESFQGMENWQTRKNKYRDQVFARIKSHRTVGATVARDTRDEDVWKIAAGERKSLFRSKSLVVDKVQSFWSSNVCCTGNRSDADICGLIY
ncbi:uncharacterized protein LOC112494414 [Cephus cinctus]|uniref:Uncharacterized protein LOC112494414 n=1 Tax=Cephus cinctus TaxID=211228 RepID=A0AAJ7RJ50_CEPCN|nr:uncharacterized protein LOC112494414 [Cephus cinctus]